MVVICYLMGVTNYHVGPSRTVYVPHRAVLDYIKRPHLLVLPVTVIDKKQSICRHTDSAACNYVLIWQSAVALHRFSHVCLLHLALITLTDKAGAMKVSRRSQHNTVNLSSMKLSGKI